MEVSGVYSSSKSAYPQVVLKQVDGSAYLPIVIGRFEAAAISMAQAARQPARPISYDLAQSVLETIGASIERVEITELHEGTYYAEVHLRAADGTVSVVDSRPSDAIALALRMGAPIFAAPAVLKEAGTVRPEEPAAAAGTPVAAAGTPVAAAGTPVAAAGTPLVAAEAPVAGSAPAPAAAPPGPVPAAREVQVPVTGSPVESLERRLRQAVAAEEYEEAARLRDQIRHLARQAEH